MPPDPRFEASAIGRSSLHDQPRCGRQRLDEDAPWRIQRPDSQSAVAIAAFVNDMKPAIRDVTPHARRDDIGIEGAPALQRVTRNRPGHTRSLLYNGETRLSLR
jgi:hypothetical protein